MTGNPAAGQRRPKLKLAKQGSTRSVRACRAKPYAMLEILVLADESPIFSQATQEREPLHRAPSIAATAHFGTQHGSSFIGPASKLGKRADATEVRAVIAETPWCVAPAACSKPPPEEKSRKEPYLIHQRGAQSLWHSRNCSVLRLFYLACIASNLPYCSAASGGPPLLLTDPSHAPRSSSTAQKRASTRQGFCWSGHLQLGAIYGGLFGLAGRIVVETQRREPSSIFGILDRISSSAVFGSLLLALLLLLAWVGDRKLRKTPFFALATLLVWSFFIPCAWLIKWTAGIFPSDALAGVVLDNPMQTLEAGMDGSWGLVFVASTIIFGSVALGWIFLTHSGVQRFRTKRISNRLTRNCFGYLAILGACIVFFQSLKKPLCPEAEWARALLNHGEVAMISDDPRLEAFVASYPLIKAPSTERQQALSTNAFAKDELQGQGTTSPQPNVLFIMLESVPVQRMGYAGYHRQITPNIDEIARSAWNFRRAWTSSTQSNYAQPSALSSQVPIRSYRLDTYKSTPYPKVFFHEFFAQHGYQTAMISSQNEEWMGMKRFVLSQSRPETYFHAKDHPGPHIGVGTMANLPDHVTADKIIAWLKGPKKERPWALYINFQRTHFPYDPAGYTGRFQPSTVKGAFNYFYYPKSETQSAINRYDNALEYVDQQVGRVYQALKAQGLLENTIVVLSSDHGEHFYERGYVTHGKSISETETRVPLLIRWPKKLRPQELGRPASTIDILPTLAKILDLPSPPEWQGHSLVPVHPKSPTRPAVFIRLQGINHFDGVVCWPWKLSYDRAARSYELYHLLRDPKELHNEVQDHEPLAGVLAKLLFAQVNAQLSYYGSFVKGASTQSLPPPLYHCPSAQEMLSLEQHRLAKPPTAQAAGLQAASNLR